MIDEAVELTVSLLHDSQRASAIVYAPSLTISSRSLEQSLDRRQLGSAALNDALHHQGDVCVKARATHTSRRTKTAHSLDIHSGYRRAGTSLTCKP